MTIKIQHKRSAVKGKAPLPADLEYGEIAVNYEATDPALYVKDSADAVRRIGELPLFTQAGTGAKPRSYDSKFKDVVSVKDFGAVGNATTDDTAAIQAAFTYASSSGYAIYIPSGTYRITVPIRTGMAGPSLKIYGDGSLHSTILQQTAGANGIEHNYNPITVAVAGTTCTVTSAHPHGLSSGSISLPSNKGPVSRLPKAFLGPKTIAVTSPTVFTFAVASGTTTPGSQTGFLTPSHARAISIEGIAVKAGQLPGGIANIKGGAAFIVALEGSGPNTSQWNDVLVRGWNANGSNGWEKGAVVYGPTGLRWSNIVMQGRNSFSEKPSAECVGITLSTYSSQGAGSSGPVDGAYNAKFTDIELNYWAKAIDLRSEQQEVIATDETHGLEGIVFDSVEAGGHHFCSHTNNIWSASKPSQLGLSLKFLNCNAELSGYAFDFNGAGNVDIVGGTWLMNGGEKGNVPTGERINYDVCKFTNTENVRVSGTEVVVFFTVGGAGTPAGPKGYLFNFADGKVGMKNNGGIIDTTRWTVQDAGQLDVAGGVHVGAQGTNIRELAGLLVKYVSQGPILTRQAGATNCFSQSFVAAMNDGDHRITCDEYGNVLMMCQQIVTPDGAREAVLRWPAGLFSTVDPFIQVQVADADTADVVGYTVPAVDLDWLSNASVKIRYAITPDVIGKTHRVAVSVSGKA